MTKTQCFQCWGLGSIPGQGTRSHMPQLKIPSAATKTWSSQINIKKKKRERAKGREGHMVLEGGFSKKWALVSVFD